MLEWGRLQSFRSRHSIDCSLLLWSLDCGVALASTRRQITWKFINSREGKSFWRDYLGWSQYVKYKNVWTYELSSSWASNWWIKQEPAFCRQTNNSSWWILTVATSSKPFRWRGLHVLFSVTQLRYSPLFSLNQADVPIGRRQTIFVHYCGHKKGSVLNFILTISLVLG